MIDFLVLGTTNDPHVDRVVSRLTKRGLHCELVDANGTQVTLFQAPDHELQITVNGHPITNNCLIWNRPKLFPGIPFYFPELREAMRSDPDCHTVLRFCVHEWTALCQLLTFLRPRQTVNNPILSPRLHKVVQQVVANSLGLSTPPTLITTEKDTAVKFLSAGGQHILKQFSEYPVGQLGGNEGGLFTQLVTANDVQSAGRRQLEVCPHMFQTAIQKSYELRIVVVGDAVFSFRVNSLDKEYTKVDWRHGNHVLKFERTTVPQLLVSKLFDFMHRLDLFSGCFDFIVDDVGEYWFLECNHQGAWGWLDDVVDGEIADAFANAFEARLRVLRLERAEPDLSGVIRNLASASLTPSVTAATAARAV